MITLSYKLSTNHVIYATVTDVAKQCLDKTSAMEKM